MKKAIKVALASALMSIGAIASAATVTQQSATIVDITHLNSPVDFGFQSFNASLGTLNSVEVSFYSTIGGFFGVENTGAAQTVSVGSGALFTLNVGGLAPIQVKSLYSQNVALGSFDGDEDFDGTSGTVVLFSGKNVVASTGVLSSQAAISAFSGNSLTSLVSGVYAGVGSGNVSYVGGSNVDTYAVLSYNYTAAPVPEPETYAMLLAGLGLVGAIARRRKSA
ncbi:MAG: FxDxF family PEP-CTERM protein [Burkholderiaceae bacterium]|nr:FxDxF family PEP-CTERM protein [Burkholderiaceae bacterium]